jgi:hypothetical protein
VTGWPVAANFSFPKPHFSTIDRGVGVQRRIMISSYSEMMKIACAVLVFMSTASMPFAIPNSASRADVPDYRKITGRLQGYRAK